MTLSVLTTLLICLATLSTTLMICLISAVVWALASGKDKKYKVERETFLRTEREAFLHSQRADFVVTRQQVQKRLRQRRKNGV